MSVFDLLRRGPKTSEFWLAIAGAVVSGFAIKEGVQATNILVGMSPVLAQIFGRNVFKAAAALKAGELAGGQVRGALRDTEVP